MMKSKKLISLLAATTVDTVTGATSTSETFKSLAEKALESAK